MIGPARCCNRSPEVFVSLTFQPVTPDRWPDLDRLFSASAGEELGNPSRCWCMEQRIASRDEWIADAGEPNRQAMRALIERGSVPGILAFDGDEPVGWCSVSPRATLTGLQAFGGFRNFGRPGVWSVSCFYVPESRRGTGVMKQLLRSAVEHAVASGATIIEAYAAPREAFGDGAGGSVPLFEAAGFVEVAQPHEAIRTMRYFVEPGGSAGR
jgi:L-amino acid N-acyltransferase YncA